MVGLRFEFFILNFHFHFFKEPLTFPLDGEDITFFKFLPAVVNFHSVCSVAKGHLWGPKGHQLVKRASCPQGLEGELRSGLNF